jgi:hypothetical protein
MQRKNKGFRTNKKNGFHKIWRGGRLGINKKSCEQIEG